MKLKDFIPRYVVNHFKLIRLKYKNSESIINTYNISNSCQIGRECIIDFETSLSLGTVVGDYSYINSNCNITNTQIGTFTSISSNCVIGASQHPINYMSTSPRIYSENNILGVPAFFESKPKKTIIGDDCWIGANVVIMDGVKVGNGSIIGAGAVVTKDIEEYSIAVGTPAKVIKKRFDEKSVEYLRKINWTQLPLKDIRKMKGIFIKKDFWNEPDL
ncbi:CatB-related O-acetyltransferase [Mesobacillus harenae]|uniref:CatB-related O-acetyltransferase n=1 Tax=Mesobacillus harenae TaxID=2213203 RepID=UPI0015803FC1|nr:CatB-related O-acetyltransferase [Mesobacillus harenae]